jgi:hypothetical protein
MKLKPGRTRALQPAPAQMALEDVAHALDVSRQRISQLRQAGDFPAPDIQDTARIQRWSPASIALYAATAGRPFRFALPGTAPLPDQPRWRAADRFQLTGLATHPNISDRWLVAVQIDVFTPAVDFGAAQTPQAALWITPLWPAATIDLTSWAIAGAIKGAIRRIDALRATVDVAATGDPVVTVVITEVDTKHPHGRDQIRPLSGDVLHGEDLAVIDWFTRHTAPAPLAAAFGQQLPVWPYGSNTADEVRVHEPGATQVVLHPGHRALYRPVIDYAVSEALRRNDSDLASLARTLDLTRSHYLTVGDPPAGMYLAARNEPAALPDSLPDGGEAFDAIDRLLMDPSTPLSVVDGLFGTLGDVMYSTPYSLDLTSLTKGRRDAIRSSVLAGDVVAAPLPGRLKRLRAAALKLSQGVGEETIHRIATTDPDRPAYAILDANVVTWITPGTRMLPRYETTLLSTAAAVEALIATRDLGSTDGYPRYAGWLFRKDSPAVPLPLRNDGMAPTDQLVQLLTGRDDTLAPMRSRDDPLMQLERQVEQAETPVVVKWQDLQLWTAVPPQDR